MKAHAPLPLWSLIAPIAGWLLLALSLLGLQGGLWLVLMTVALIAGVTADATAKVKAGELVNAIAGQVGGKGGGKADMAMAGGTEPAKLAGALDSVQAWVTAKL